MTSPTHKPGRRFLSTVIAVLLAMGGIATFVWVQLHRTVVTLRYDGVDGTVLSDIALQGEGPAVALGTLSAGQQRDVALPLRQAGGVRLRFRLGEQRCRWSGGYVEPTGGYRVRLVVAGCEQLEVAVGLWPWGRRPARR